MRTSCWRGKENEKKAHIAGPPKLIECLKQQGFPGGLVVS